MKYKPYDVKIKVWDEKMYPVLALDEDDAIDEAIEEMILEFGDTMEYEVMEVERNLDGDNN